MIRSWFKRLSRKSISQKVGNYLCDSLVISTYNSTEKDVEEHEEAVDDDGDGDGVGGHPHLVADLLVDQPPLQLLPEGPTGDLGIDPLTPEPAATASTVQVDQPISQGRAHVGQHDQHDADGDDGVPDGEDLARHGRRRYVTVT